MKPTVTITGIDQVNAILGVIAPNEARNILRATVYDMAKQAADVAKQYTPDDPNTGKGDLKSSIKPNRDKSPRDKALASVRVTNTKRNYFWRFLEYGDGPDGIEHAMFGKTLELLRPVVSRVYMDSFGKKLAARLARLRK